MSPSTLGDRQSQVWLARLAIAALALGALYRALTNTLNHDAAWYLVATARWLDGAVLYRDIIEVNPPLAFFLTAPAVALARGLDLFPVSAFVLYVFALAAVSLLLTWRLLRDLPGYGTTARHILVGALLCALLLLPGPDFGQREHLMVIFAVPYIVLAAVRAEGRGPGMALALFVGSWAALGLALKPYFLVVPLALEIYLFLRGRRWLRALRPETLALGFWLVAYLAFVAVVMPAYLTVIVPYARTVYFAYEADPLQMLLFSRLRFLLPLVFAGAYLAVRRAVAERSTSDILILSSLGLLAVFFLQGKGWNYHLYPALAMTLLGGIACTLALLESRAVTRGDGTPQAGRLTALAIAVLPLFLLADAQVLRGGYGNSFQKTFTPIVREHATGRSIYLFSAHVLTTYPLALYENARPVSRYPALWLLPGLVRRTAEPEATTDAEKQRLDAIECFVRDSVVEDLQRDPPALIIVDARERKAYFGEFDFDYIEFFMQDERFADLWRSYEFLTSAMEHDVYLRRADAAPTSPGSKTGQRSAAEGCSTNRP